MLTDREQQILKLIENDPLIAQQAIADICGITRSSVAVHISNLTRKGAIRGKGYVLQQGPYITVLGGQNMDIFGRPSAPLIAQDSNPGIVRMSAGGVGRNIAHNLALLGEDVKLLTAFGEDAAAAQLADGCRAAGIDVTESLTVPGAASSTYLFITNEHGDMELAINDMGIYKHLTPDYVAAKLPLINGGAVCVADTNPEEETLRYLAQNCKCPLFVDAVSTVKAKKLQKLLPYIHTIKVNRMEAQLLTGVRETGEDAVPHMAAALLDAGVQRVFLSLGGQGMYACTRNEAVQLPCFEGEVANTTGAGDSLMATIAWAWRMGFTLRDTAMAGLAAASICLASAETVNPALSAESVLQRAGLAR